MTKTKAKQPSPYGTWYTDAGERADAWPAETMAKSTASAANQNETLVASSVHAMAGAGGGLVSRLLGAFSPAPICRLL